MAKSKSGHPSDNKPKAQKFPSTFGSHRSMIDVALTAELTDPTKVVLRDEFKEPYITDRNRLDNGCADPNRYPTSRLDELLQRAKKDDKD